MSPILVRPVREQLEHDRVIRLLQVKFRRRFDAGVNPAAEQNAPVGVGLSAVFPDVVLTTPDRSRKIQAVIEVETVESVNNLEALAEWVPYGRLRPPFHLYVPASMADVAKRLCTDFNVQVAEIHSYHWVGDEMRFLSVYKAPASAKASARPSSGKPSARQARAPKKKVSKPGKTAARKPAASRKAGRSSKRK
ncbi:MAG TPA: hypothetical protein VJM31_07915 [Vicinamibacterales bacterium]|nr:hypothetical protein [Vicinamibacterales bacterium]